MMYLYIVCLTNRVERGRYTLENRDEVFSALYQENAAKMVRYAAGQLRNRDLAEELVEDAFVLLLRKYDQLTDHPNLPGWLWKTLQHLILTEVKSARHRLEVPLEQDFDLAAPEEDRSALADALPEGLSDRDREILLLFFEEELTHEEVAARLGISILNSRTRLFRAKNRCKELLEKMQKNTTLV